VWSAAGEVFHRPAPSEDPALICVLGRVTGDALQVVVLPLNIVELALRLDDPPVQRVDVGVLEAGQEHAPVESDDFGSGPAPYLDIRQGADPHDPPVLDRDGLSPRARSMERVDTCAGQEKVGLFHVARLSGPEPPRGKTLRAS
jgi:hypothetical protein